MILGNAPTNPGELRTPITLYKRSVTNGTGGFKLTEKGTKIADMYARWENVHGSEVWGAASLLAIDAATALIRYHASLDATCLVEKGSGLYEIVSLDNIRERNEYIELKVKRVMEG